MYPSYWLYIAVHTVGTCVHVVIVFSVSYGVSHSQVWNHPWVLRLDEDRKFEREERRRMLGESDEDPSLEGFIVSGSEEEEGEEDEEEEEGEGLDLSAIIDEKRLKPGKKKVVCEREEMT